MIAKVHSVIDMTWINKGQENFHVMHQIKIDKLLDCILHSEFINAVSRTEARWTNFDEKTTHKTVDNTTQTE